MQGVTSSWCRGLVSALHEHPRVQFFYYCDDRGGATIRLFDRQIAEAYPDLTSRKSRVFFRAQHLVRREKRQKLPCPNSPSSCSWDTANKSGDLNDFSVCTTWGAHDKHFYLLDVVRVRLNYPDLKRRVGELAKKYAPRVILIEDKASGTQLIQDLKADGLYRVKPYPPPPGTDKVMRLYAQTAEFENGRVLLPSSAAWLAEYIRELTTFPGVKFDDQVDSTTQALDHMRFGRCVTIYDLL